MIGLQHEMTCRLRVRGPMTPTRGSPRGERQYWEMSEGTLTFDTGAEQNAWLNRRLYLAEGRLAGKDEIGYRVYYVI